MLRQAAAVAEQRVVLLREQKRLLTTRAAQAVRRQACNPCEVAVASRCVTHWLRCAGGRS
jgi:hypothetical protein